MRCLACCCHQASPPPPPPAAATLLQVTDAVDTPPWPTARTRRPMPSTAQTRRCGARACTVLQRHAGAAACRRPSPAAPSLTSHSSCLPPGAQNLIEYISRQKIYDSVYWKQECFGLSAERLVDKAVELKEVRCFSLIVSPDSHLACWCQQAHRCLNAACSRRLDAVLWPRRASASSCAACTHAWCCCSLAAGGGHEWRACKAHALHCAHPEDAAGKAVMSCDSSGLCLGARTALGCVWAGMLHCRHVVFCARAAQAGHAS